MTWDFPGDPVVDCTAGGVVRSLMGKLSGFPGGSVVKNPPANEGDTGDAGSIPGLGRFRGEGNDWKPSILAWEIPWTEGPGRLQPIGLQSKRLK